MRIGTLVPQVLKYLCGPWSSRIIVSCLKRRIDRTGCLNRLEPSACIVKLMIPLGHCACGLVEDKCSLPNSPTRKKEGNRVFGKKNCLYEKKVLLLPGDRLGLSLSPTESDVLHLFRCHCSDGMLVFLMSIREFHKRIEYTVVALHLGVF